MIKFIGDESRAEDERVDAKGYLAICQFKILGNLHDSSEEERAKKFQELRGNKVFSKYFGILDGEATYQKVFDSTKQYAESLVRDHDGKETYSDQSVLNSAYAVLIKLPFFDSRLSREEKFSAVDEACQNYATVHFESAQKAATLGEEVGNGRGYVFLRTAYEFANNPPYRANVSAISGDVDLEGLRMECARNSATCGNLSSYGTIGESYYKNGDLENAEENFRIAADAGFAEFQYRLGVLLFQTGHKDQGLSYLQKADANEFDVAGGLQKEIKNSSDNPARKIILEKVSDEFGKSSDSKAEELDTQETKSFVGRSDKIQGKSAGGFNEL